MAIDVLDYNSDRVGILSKTQLRNLKVFYFLNMFLLVTDYIMPQYFGLDIGYDLTCTRLGNILILMYLFFNPKLFTHFSLTVIKCKLSIPFALYLLVCAYTMVLRVDINAFFMVFFEVLTLYMLIYGIKYVIGVPKAIKWGIYSAYFFGFLGLADYALGESLMLRFLKTVPTSVANVYRSGQYRIMGPCGHSLGYGLYLILLVPLTCIDFQKKEIFIFKRPLLMVLLLLNVFLTGSRSTLGIVVLELFLILLCSKRKNVKKTFIYLLALIAALGIFLLLFYNTKIGQYVLMQLASIIDQFFGTEYAALFGAETTRLDDSEEYRKMLPFIFTLDWLNPLVGRGVSRSFSVEINGFFIESIDNYYIMQYIKYAYPGLVSYVLIILSTVGMMISAVRKYKNPIMKMALVGTVCYFINLWWVDALQTLKYEYIIIAIFYVLYTNLEEESAMKRALAQKKSQDGE
uniref:hypothetical protein n=1 Tax=Acetatifactor sp. TaxID=1872090 RepID=UPI004055C670